MSDPRFEGQSYEERCAILEARLAAADELHSRYVKAVGELAGMAARLAEAERLLNNIQFILPLDSPTYRSWHCQYDTFLKEKP